MNKHEMIEIRGRRLSSDEVRQALRGLIAVATPDDLHKLVDDI